MRVFATCVLFLSISPAQAGPGDTISKVVSLLQDMLDKSKEDGTNDRTLYAKFKCFCDTTTEAKKTAIANEEDQIETLEALLAAKRAHNSELSQDVAKLQASMDDNEAARDEATTLRNSENTSFKKEKKDLETGISQLDRAIDILSAVGADQTVSGDSTSEKLLAADATAAAKGAFMEKKGNVHKGHINLKGLDTDMKEALRAASVFLSGSQRKKVTAFMQGPTANYNSQSGEIVGVIKSMSDTFKSNLASAITAEDKAQSEYDALMAVKQSEFDEMEKAHTDKKKTIGDNSGTISTKSSELETVQGELASDTQFLADLTDRCALKKKEYEHRTMLRTNEEAAIAQAISILNSDEAFATFDEAGVQTFVQLDSKDSVRSRVAQSLMGKHSRRLTRIAQALKAANPFEKVLQMIDESIAVIDQEEKADDEKHAWCAKEQADSNADSDDKEDDIATLNGNIGDLETSISDTKDLLAQAQSDLKDNQDDQAFATKTRADEKAVFDKEIANADATQAILTKAIEVLEKYYKFMKAHNAEKTYAEHAGKDSGGGNLERLAGKSIVELKEACNEKPECVGFNSAGWLKSSLADQSEWYDWEDGTLYVKELSGGLGFIQLTQDPVEGEPESFGMEMKGQSKEGGEAIGMLKFILGESEKEETDLKADEDTAISDFESNMNTLTGQESDLKEDIAAYELNLANDEKSLMQATEDKNAATGDNKAINAYLDSIEPGCTFIQSNLDKRKDARSSEKAALENAITTLKGTPVFQAAMAAAENERLGKCVLKESDYACGKDGSKRGEAKCEACVEGVTVYGYCTQNPSASGCSDATATSSAGALA